MQFGIEFFWQQIGYARAGLWYRYQFYGTALRSPWLPALWTSSSSNILTSPGVGSSTFRLVLPITRRRSCSWRSALCNSSVFFLIPFFFGATASVFWCSEMSRWSRSLRHLWINSSTSAERKRALVGLLAYSQKHSHRHSDFSYVSNIQKFCGSQQLLSVNQWSQIFTQAVQPARRWSTIQIFNYQ